MTALVLYPLLTAAAFYLGSRALVTEAIWSRYPARFAAFMDCAACAGTWYGLAVGIAGAQIGLPFLGLPGAAWYVPLLVAACSMIWTPIVAAVHQAALERLGSAVPASAVDNSGEPVDKSVSG